jgi:CRP/FNR family transcriptional regulator, cyclic AMP receptor protein
MPTEEFSRPIAEILGCHPFAHAWTSAQVECLAGCGTKYALRRGEYLWRQGEKLSNLYLICSGEAALEISLPQQGAVQIEEFGSGDVLGAPCLANGQRASFDARAVTGLQALCLHGKLLGTAFAANHELAHEVFQRFAAVTFDKLESTRLRLLELYRPRRH